MKLIVKAEQELIAKIDCGDIVEQIKLLLLGLINLVDYYISRKTEPYSVNKIFTRTILGISQYFSVYCSVMFYILCTAAPCFANRLSVGHSTPGRQERGHWRLTPRLRGEKALSQASQGTTSWLQR